MPRLRATPKERLNEKERGLWDRMLAFCRNAGAWVVSEPYQRRVEIEAMEDSTLYDELQKLGFPIFKVGQRDKLLPKTEVVPQSGNKVYRDYVTAQSVNVYEVSLPEINASSLD
jgi:hypothetical protein